VTCAFPYKNDRRQCGPGYKNDDPDIVAQKENVPGPVKKGKQHWLNLIYV
jgi:hypothetical protein